MVKQSFLILEVFLFQYQQIERVDFSVESKSIFLLQVEGSFLPFIGLLNSDWPKDVKNSDWLANEKEVRPVPVLQVREVEEEHFAFDHERIVIPELY